MPVADLLPVSDFAARCLDELPGIPPPILSRMVREVARDLCRAGRLWRFIHPEITTDSDTDAYTLLKTPECGMVHDIDVVTLDNQQIYPQSQSLTIRSACNVFWTRLPPNGIRLSPTNGLGGKLVVQSVLIPTPNACDLPDVLMSEWIETLEHGVKGRLMMQSKKEWSDPATGGVYFDQWKNGLAVAMGYGRNGSATARRRSVDGWAR